MRDLADHEISREISRRRNIARQYVTSRRCARYRVVSGD